jgi:hypothetical protein
MTRRTLITILIGLLAAVLIGVVWYLFFHTGATPINSTGTFGTGQTRTSTSTDTTQTPTNIPSSIGQTVGSGGVTGVNGGGVVITSSGGSTGTTSSTVVNGVNWLSGSSVGGGSGTAFNPAAINQLNGGSVGGSVSVLGTYTSPDTSGGDGSSLAAGLIAGTAIACTAFMIPGVGSVGSFTQVPPAVNVNNSTTNNKSFMDCLARTIAKAALQQITNSVVNWINSGFNGSPSFITNYQQFFNNVADAAAGSFIQNFTNFAPYCTPFAKQIQIALANSYARRNSAQSCTLSTLLGTNIFNPQSGSASWGNLVSFTTNPSNNPYGAYMSAQAQLTGTINQASQNANKNISPGGFLNFQQPYNCTNPASSNAGGASVTGSVGSASQSFGYTCPQGCQCKTTTPGSIIQTSLSNTLNVSQSTLQQAGVSGSFDAILSALITQLMTRALQGGVSNLSGTSGYSSYYLTPDQQAAQDQGQALLTNLQGLVVLAQQYGQSEQGSISDIQTAQGQLSNLANCWQSAASSTSLKAAQQNIAASDEQSALNTLHSFDAQVDSLNVQITRANAAIATLQDLQTRTLNVGSTADVTALQTELSSDDAQGEIIEQADVTQAQQDRSTLQVQLSSLNTSTASQLQQCNAF